MQGLEVEGLTLRLSGRRVLDGVTFAVPAGRVVGLLGPNGAGKTTTMRVVLGIIDAECGAVRWQGREASQGDRARWGYMPQERGLYPKMPVGDQVRYFGRLRGLSRADATERADKLLTELGLEERGGDKVEQLSGGMQQRAQLAATLIHDPEVLVLDEPFAGLDPVGLADLAEVIAAQAAAGRTVVFSSHQLDVVEDLCETIVLVDRGRVVLEGDLGQLRAASLQRFLRVRVDVPVSAWAEEVPRARLVREANGGALLELAPDADPLAVLDAVRARHRVTDFALEQPRLSQLFREAVQP